VILDGERDRECLDRERVNDVVRGQRIDDVCRDAEVGEGLQNGLLVVPRPFVDPTPAFCRGSDVPRACGETAACYIPAYSPALPVGCRR
jgi:hypothetical protein